MNRGAEGLRRGQVVEVAIEKDVYRGRGLGRVEGRVVFVTRAHAGDRVRARIGAAHRGYAEASCVELLESAPARRDPPCPHAALCGGCAYQHLGYREQLRAKAAILRETLTRAGLPFEGDIPAYSSPERGWRTRTSLHLVKDGDALRMGFQEQGTRRLVDVRECLQLSGAMNRAAEEIRDRLSESPVAGSLRRLELAESPDGSALVATVLADVRPDEASGLAAPLRWLTGLTGLGVEIRGRESVWLEGSPYLEARILGHSLRTHARSFFQGNRFLAEPLAREVTALVPAGEGRIIDLYSGVGLFSLPLAARGEGEVVAIEGAARAAEDARSNAARAALQGLVVIPDDAERALAALAPAQGERIVLDPPRTGTGDGVVERIADRKPSCIVYVSCDPPTLARDLLRFVARGYRPDAMRVFDMFPDTFHLETVVRLRRD